MRSMGEQSKRRIRILQLEDGEFDTDWVRFELDREKLPFELRQVADEAAYLSLLDNFAPDMVLASWNEAAFSAQRALELLRQRDCKRPFICLAASAHQHDVLEAMQAGATDYICKQTPALLVPALKRAWREVEDQRVRDELNKALLRAQRFECLAILAGGLSHDLRNILQPLMLISESLRDNYPADERLRKLSALIGDCSRRGLDMVRSILDFARGVDRTEQLRLDQLFESTEHLLHGTLGGKVQWQLHSFAPQAVFLGNQTELQQCLLNLSFNAVQAMEHHGLLRVEAAECELVASFFLKGERAQPGPYLRISVADNGDGMTPEVMSRLFEPFFTTKDSGTGLGLCSCLRIVTDHGGVIRVESKLAVGTCFHLYFPLFKPALEQAESPEQVLMVEVDGLVVRL